ncbi:MAG: hypothetical protein U0520_01790 [Candidatus Saccharimonadales bacterium]
MNTGGSQVAIETRVCEAKRDNPSCSSCVRLASAVIAAELERAGLSTRSAASRAGALLSQVEAVVDTRFPASTVVSDEFPGQIGCGFRRSRVQDTAVEVVRSALDNS